MASTLTSGYGIQFELFLGDFKFSYTVDRHIVADEEKESIMWAGISRVPMDPYFGSHQIYNFNYEPNDLPVILKTSFTKIKLNSTLDTIEFLTVGIEFNNYIFYTSAETLIVKTGDNEWDGFGDFRYGYSVTAGYYIFDDLEIHINANIYENSHVGDPGKTYNISEANRWKDFSIGITKGYNNLEIRADIHKVYGGRVLEPTDWTKDIDDWWYIGTSIVYHF